MKAAPVILIVTIFMLLQLSEPSVQAVSSNEPSTSPIQEVELVIPEVFVPTAAPSETSLEPVFRPYDIPLSIELQEYTHWLCEAYNVPMTLILAVMQTESNFRTDVVSDTNDYGPMQINYVNHGWLADEYGLTDMMDPKQNIEAGVLMLNELYDKYEDVHKTLMAYNCGEAGAKRLWEKDIYSSSYSRKVEVAMFALED